MRSKKAGYSINFKYFTTRSKTPEKHIYGMGRINITLDSLWAHRRYRC